MAYMGKIKKSYRLSPQQKFKNSLKRAGYDPDEGAKRLLDLLAKHKKEREEREGIKEELSASNSHLDEAASNSLRKPDEQTGVMSWEDLSKHIGRSKALLVAKHPQFQEHISPELSLGAKAGFRFKREHGFEHVDVVHGPNKYVDKDKPGRRKWLQFHFSISGKKIHQVNRYHNMDNERHPEGNLIWHHYDTWVHPADKRENKRIAARMKERESVFKEEKELSIMESRTNRTKRTPIRDFLRKYPVSDAEMAKPVKKPEKKKPDQNVAESVKIIDRDSDLDQEHFMLNVNGKKEHFVHHNYENSHATDSKEDIHYQVKTQLKHLTPKHQKAVTNAVHASYRMNEAVIKEDAEGVAEMNEAVSVKKANYSWGKMVTVHHGSDTSYPLHPEHQAAIKKLKPGESTSFTDETNRKVTASREGDQVHLSGRGSNKRTTVAHSHFAEGNERESVFKSEIDEAGPFSYGAKPPRKGSVAYNALMKRKEQDKKRVKEIEAIGTKNHYVGVAKVTKYVAEGYTGRETKDGTWRVFKDGQAVAVAGPFKSRDEAHAWIKNHHVGVAKVTKEEIEDVIEAKDDTYKYIDQTKGPVLRGKTGTYVGYTHSSSKGKGANILKHNKTKKYYAAGGSSTAFTQKTTLHDTPEDAARAYHKGNLAEASPMIKPPKAAERLSN